MTREEAIEVASEMYGRFKTDREREALETLIPEFSESEDERMIRKIELFLSAYGSDYFSDDEWREIEVWLEKQKEQKSSEELVIHLRKLMREYYKSGKDDVEKKHRFMCCKLFWDALEDSEFFFKEEKKPVDDGTREILVRRAKCERQAVLLSESFGISKITFDTRSLEDAKKLLEYGLAFINEQLGSKVVKSDEGDNVRLHSIADFVEYEGREEDAEFLRSIPSNIHGWDLDDETNMLFIQSVLNSVLSKNYTGSKYWTDEQIEELLEWCKNLPYRNK